MFPTMQLFIRPRKDRSFRFHHHIDKGTGITSQGTRDFKGRKDHASILLNSKGFFSALCFSVILISQAMRLPPRPLEALKFTIVLNVLWEIMSQVVRAASQDSWHLVLSMPQILWKKASHCYLCRCLSVPHHCNPCARLVH